MSNLYEKTLRNKSVELIKNTIQLSLTKGELNTILAEAMQDEVTGNAIKRILNPFLVNSFPQFPEHINVSLGSTDGSGSTVVTLKVPTKKTVATEDSSSEPFEDVVYKD